MFFVQINHTGKGFLFLIFREIKLRKYSSLHKIFYGLQEMLGPHLRLTGRSNFTYLKFDHSIRTNKSILALALLNNQNYMIPISLLNLKFIHPFPNGEKIIKIESRDLKTGKITILN